MGAHLNSRIQYGNLGVRSLLFTQAYTGAKPPSTNSSTPDTNPDPGGLEQLGGERKEWRWRSSIGGGREGSPMPLLDHGLNATLTGMFFELGT